MKHLFANSGIAFGEWKAWVDSAFLLVILAVMAQGIEIYLAKETVMGEIVDRGYGRLLATLFIAWAVAAYLLRKYRRDKVMADERDLRIALETTQLSLYMMVCGMIAFAVSLSANPLDRLQWLSYPLIAHLLIMIMAAAHLIGNLAQIVYYVRDRRGAAA